MLQAIITIAVCAVLIFCLQDWKREACKKAFIDGQNSVMDSIVSIAPFSKETAFGIFGASEEFAELMSKQAGRRVRQIIAAARLHITSEITVPEEIKLMEAALKPKTIHEKLYLAYGIGQAIPQYKKIASQHPMLGVLYELCTIVLTDDERQKIYTELVKDEAYMQADNTSDTEKIILEKIGQALDAKSPELGKHFNNTAKKVVKGFGGDAEEEENHETDEVPETTTRPAYGEMMVVKDKANDPEAIVPDLIRDIMAAQKVQSPDKN